nr:cuticle protein 14-like [Parasteatoda tepidariorum]
MRQKALLFLFCGLFVSSEALPVVIEANALEAGASTQYKTEDNHGNYAFGYSEGHTSGGSFRKEVGDSLGNKVGSYGLHNADGRTRVVNYVADSAGLRADIHTNEPGVDGSQDTAHTAINKPAIAAVVAPAVLAKTVVAAPAFAHHAPVFHPTLFHAPLTLFAHGGHILL